jgi:Na+/H+ antiporter NhaD/arsenite permease-like protein
MCIFTLLSLAKEGMHAFSLAGSSLPYDFVLVAAAFCLHFQQPASIKILRGLCLDIVFLGCGVQLYFLIIFSCSRFGVIEELSTVETLRY